MASEKYRVLVLDDDKDTLELIHLPLSPHYEVLTLQSAAETYENLDYFEPDLAIIDIMMPKVTGYQVVEYLKKNPKYQKILIIILSAKDNSRDVKYGYKLGANVYLTKPFNPERLLKNVQMLLDAALVGEPKRKQLSMRDVTLRLQHKVHHMATPPAAAGDANETPDPSSSQPKLKRPLAQEAQEMDSKKWVG
jgi:DNA-binding response OmpR family regulator